MPAVTDWFAESLATVADNFELGAWGLVDLGTDILTAGNGTTFAAEVWAEQTSGGSEVLREDLLTIAIPAQESGGLWAPLADVPATAADVLHEAAAGAEERVRAALGGIEGLLWLLGTAVVIGGTVYLVVQLRAAAR